MCLFLLILIQTNYRVMKWQHSIDNAVLDGHMTPDTHWLPFHTARKCKIIVMNDMSIGFFLIDECFFHQFLYWLSLYLWAVSWIQFALMWHTEKMADWVYVITCTLDLNIPGYKTRYLPLLNQWNWLYLSILKNLSRQVEVQPWKNVGTDTGFPVILRLWSKTTVITQKLISYHLEIPWKMQTHQLVFAFDKAV